MSIRQHIGALGARLRRFPWRKLAKICAGVVGGVVLLLVAVRLYFSDERLRVMAVDELHKRAQTDVDLAALEVSLLSGIELRGFRVGKIDGFEAPETLAFERLALRWSSWRLLLLQVVVEELALERPRVHVEVNAAGLRNTDVLAQRLAGPPKPSPPPVAPPATPEPAVTAQPKKPPAFDAVSVPVHVIVRAIRLVDAQVALQQPGLTLTLDRVGVEGSVDAEDKRLGVDFWVGLGERRPEGEPSKLYVEVSETRSVVEVRQRFGVHLAMTGLHDIRVKLYEEAITDLRGPRTLTGLQVTGGIETAVNLLRQELELSTFRWQLGRGSAFDLRMKVLDFLGAPKLAIEPVTFTLALDELSPLAASFVAGASMGGSVKLETSALNIGVDELQHLQRKDAEAIAVLRALASRILLDVRDVRLLLGDKKVEGLRSQLSADVRDGALHVTWGTAIDELRAGPQRVDDLDMQLSMATGLTELLTHAGNGEVALRWETRLGRVRAPQADVARLRLAIDAHAPVAMLQRRAAHAPLRAVVELDTGPIDAPTATLAGLRVNVQSQAWDLAGQLVDADVRALVEQPRAKVGDAWVQLPDVRLGLGTRRSPERVVLREASFELGRLLRLAASGTIDAPQSAAPRFDELVATLRPFRVEELIALLPPEKRPAAQVTGSVGVDLRLHGRVPYRELTAAAQLPPADPARPADWSAKLAGYNDMLQRWAARFAAGMPFVASMQLMLSDMDVVTPTAKVQGLAMTVGLGMAERGPRFDLQLDIDAIAQPVEIADLSTALNVAVDGADLSLTFSTTLGRVVHAALNPPLHAAALRLAGSYRVGGDLVLEQLAVSAPDRGVETTASGVIAKPMQVALAQSWTRPGLPGVHASLRWRAGFDAAAPLALAPGAPELSGHAALDTALRLSDGMAVLDGRMEMQSFTAQSPTLHVQEMGGALPFDVRLVFDPRPNAIVLKRGLGVGGGVLGLVTSSDDIRTRPARPVYYDRLASYRTRQGLHCPKIRSGNYELRDLEIDGRIKEGMLVAERIALNVLGGDIVGNMAMQVTQDGRVLGDFGVKMSNMDASYFEALNVEPGPESELSADMGMGFLFGANQRDFTMNMNITKIGEETFDRFLQLLDPEGKDQKIQDTRGNLSRVDIDEVAMWIRYESLNMDLRTTPRFPYNLFGFNVARDVLRNYSLREMVFDQQVQPVLDKKLAPALGWN